MKARFDRRDSSLFLLKRSLTRLVDCQRVISHSCAPPYKAKELSMCLVGLWSLSVPTCSKGNLRRTPTVTYSSKCSAINKRVPGALSSVASLLPPYDPPASILFFTPFWQQQSVGESLGLQPPLLHPPSSLKWSLFIYSRSSLVSARTALP